MRFFKVPIKYPNSYIFLFAVQSYAIAQAKNSEVSSGVALTIEVEDSAVNRLKIRVALEYECRWTVRFRNLFASRGCDRQVGCGFTTWSKASVSRTRR